MKKYIVTAEELRTYQVEVEAESEDDAIYEAEQIVDETNHYDTDWQYNVEATGE
jgi:hypothetical protein